MLRSGVLVTSTLTVHRYGADPKLVVCHEVKIVAISTSSDEALLDSNGF